MQPLEKAYLTGILKAAQTQGLDEAELHFLLDKTAGGNWSWKAIKQVVKDDFVNSSKAFKWLKEEVAKVPGTTYRTARMDNKGIGDSLSKAYTNTIKSFKDNWEMLTPVEQKALKRALGVGAGMASVSAGAAGYGTYKLLEKEPSTWDRIKNYIKD